MDAIFLSSEAFLTKAPRLNFPLFKLSSASSASENQLEISSKPPIRRITV
jgi:hypothetical protein